MRRKKYFMRRLLTAESETPANSHKIKPRHKKEYIANPLTFSLFKLSRCNIHSSSILGL